MDIILDTSSIINLINGDVIDRILSMDQHHFFVGDQILSKEILDDVQKIIVQALIEKNKLELLRSSITASLITELQIKYKLGLGETECIALCKSCNKAICTDDLKARKCSLKELEQSRIYGSLSLLKESVSSGVLHCHDVLKSYQLMLQKGAFLPRNLKEDYFCQ